MGGIYWVRGTKDPIRSAIRVRIVERKSDWQPLESLDWGVSVLRCYDVVGDGPEFAEFERRPLFEMKGALWAKARTVRKR